MHHFHWKKIIHFHHGFTGTIITIVAIILKNDLLTAFGISMILSDIIHHFIVLKTIMGDPEFHVIYKNFKTLEKEEKLERQKIKKFFHIKKKSKFL